MRFWDASALVPLLVRQVGTDSVNALRSSDSAILVWWGTVVECSSAIAKLERMGSLDGAAAATARADLERLAMSWVEVEPSETIRGAASALLVKHELTSADAFQLAAALRAPAGDQLLEFVCLDQRLRRGAVKEGFTVLPALATDRGLREPAAASYKVVKQARRPERALRGSK